MRYITSQDTGKYPIAILGHQIRREEMIKTYLLPNDLSMEDFIFIELHSAPGKKKTPAREIKEFIQQELQQVLDDAETQYIICTDSDYFKILTKEAKAEANLGYVCDSVWGNQKVIYAPSYRQVFYDPPVVKSKIAQGMDALLNHIRGQYAEPGQGIIEFEAYPDTPEKIKAWLDQLLEMNKPLAIDIEAFGLKHYNAGIGTITFCWSKTQGIAFNVDYEPIPGATEAPYGRINRNDVVRNLLREFFIKYTQRQMYHNISYDVYVLIYQLFMDNLIDTEGLLHGMDIMLRNWDCTKLITYLATNSCAGNHLSLKDQAQEYAGNYAQDDIKDIRLIPNEQLLRYNLIDGLCTWYTYEKHWDTLIADDQLDVYNNIFKPACEDIIQMQLTGMPMNMETVNQVAKEMETDRNQALKTIRESKLMKNFTLMLRQEWVDDKNAKLKKKQVTLADCDIEFNPNSGPQLQKLLFDYIGLPVLGLTKSKQPATDGDTIKALRTHTQSEDVKELLNALIDYKLVDKIITSFIPAFRNAQPGPDGWHYLFGNLNLGGTVSGRLSASEPNLQTIPSGSKYAKKIKKCFEAAPGWVFCGLDFASLEDRISALTTKDPQKLKVYTDGYDGHSLRAYAYFGEQMPDIEDTVESINSIQHKYKSLRSDSKAPTFLLTYGGTYMGLMKNCGFSEEKAKTTEKRYHDLYVVSDRWVQAKLDEAAKTGYVTAAFGLRVRTPLLAQVLRGTCKTPYEAEAEGRTAGNALGQSWCLLNNRAGSEFMRKVRASEFRLDIRPSIHIHDAQYFMIRDNMDTLQYTNKHLVEAVNWQDHPDIAHPEVGLGGELSLFYPTWANEIEIPNHATPEEVHQTIQKAFA
ncbi:DNA polymerase [Escherichia phage IME11]|uniref:DNA polymerase I n=1 Tax=Escherichia phage IME11 TaxID=1239384 RepID=K4MPR6_9CAUD|nr:DNA polymerase [Escherichia phage IME11]AFV29079.1 DNA polymerase I [Escherichia phage IME11]